MQKMLKVLENHYQHPVDIEFAVNFTGDDAFRINLVECRPLQASDPSQTVSRCAGIEDSPGTPG
jgi:hypothetical protein